MAFSGCPGSQSQYWAHFSRWVIELVPLGCLARVALQKERLITTRSARTASATMTMPRASSTVSSHCVLPPRTRTNIPAAHTERRGRPSLRSVGPHPRSAFPPELVLIRHQETAERGLNSPSPIWGRHNADCLSNRWVRAQIANGLKASGSGCERRQRSARAFFGTKEQCGAMLRPSNAVYGQPVRPAFQRIGLEGFKTFPRARAVRLKPR